MSPRARFWMWHIAGVMHIMTLLACGGAMALGLWLSSVVFLVAAICFAWVRDQGTEPPMDSSSKGQE